MLKRMMHPNFRWTSPIQHFPWSSRTAADGLMTVYQPGSQGRVACWRRSEVSCSTMAVGEKCDMPRLWHLELLFVPCDW